MVADPPTPRNLEPMIGLVRRGLSMFLIALMAVMVLDVTWQVVSRFIMNRPSSFTEELAGFLLIWIGLLGAAYAFETRAHLGIDLLREKLGEAGSLRLDLVVNLLVILFALTVMVGGGLNLVVLAFKLDQISAAMGISMGYVYLALPLSGLLIMLFAAGAITKSRTDLAGA
ncbi:TRAP transporter small permease [Gemmatimonadota bacterium]